MRFKTVNELLRSFQSRGSSLCVSYRTDFRTFRFSYGQVHDKVMESARQLHESKVRKGDAVIIWAPNSPSWLCSFLAVSMVGAVAIPLDFRGSRELVEKVAKEVKPKFAFIGDRMPDVTIHCRTERLKPVWHATEAGKAHPKIVESGPSDLLEIIYTSGTTGDPKGVILTNNNVMSNVASAVKGITLTSKDKVISLLPLSHMFEQVGGLLVPLAHGGQIVYLERLNRRSIFSAIKEERPTFIPIVPRLLDMIKHAIENEAKQFGNEHLLGRMRRLSRSVPESMRRLVFPRVCKMFPKSSFRFFISGGAPLEQDTESFFDELGLPILQGYGLTETSPVLTFNYPGARRIGSVGKPIEGVDIKIADDGEILARGPNVSEGYFKRTDKTRELFRKGWLATGDIGAFDDEGFLFIKGRKKDLIVTSEGMNVYPEDIEAALNRIQGVKDSAVVGLKQPGGEQVHAVLLLEKGAGSPGTIIAKANSMISSYSRITGFTVWPDPDFPRTATMKVRKFKVLEYLSEKHEAGARPGRAITAPPLVRIISQVTKKPIGTIHEGSNLTSDLGLGSLDRVELLSMIEDELGASLPDEVITSKTTVRQLEKLIVSRPPSEERIKFRPWLNSWPVRLVRVFLQDLILFPIVVFFTRTAAHGKNNIQNLRGPLLIVCNHTSHFDTPVLLMHLPFRLREEVCPVAMWEYFTVKGKRPFKQFLMNRLYDISGIAVNLIPFPQTAGFGQSMKYAGSLVDKGFSILVFPEGARTLDGNIHAFKDGVGMMAVNYKIPILPVKVSGLWETLPRGKFWPRLHPSTISFGAPFMVKSDDYREAAREIEGAVRIL